MMGVTGKRRHWQRIIFVHLIESREINEWKIRGGGTGGMTNDRPNWMGHGVDDHNNEKKNNANFFFTSHSRMISLRYLFYSNLWDTFVTICAQFSFVIKVYISPLRKVYTTSYNISLSGWKYKNTGRPQNNPSNNAEGVRNWQLESFYRNNPSLKERT